MSNLHRGHSIDASYQVSVHLAKRQFTFHILIFSSENPRPNELKFGRKHLRKVLYKDWSFCPNPLTSMAATSHSYSDWLISKKSSLVNGLGRNEQFL
jgi:hypothetical protein